METRAIARFVRISPRKARVVVDLIRGKSVPQAREILAFTNRATTPSLCTSRRATLTRARR